MTLFIENYRRYSEHATIWDMFKTIALISMIFGHFGSYFAPDEQWLRMVGRVCVPIWFMLAGFGYRPEQRNIAELLMLGGCLIFVDLLFNDPMLPLNILITHIFGRFFLSRIANYGRDIVTLIIISVMLLLLWLPSNILFEYGTEVFFFMLAGFYAAAGNKRLAIITLILSTCLYLSSQIMAFRFNNEQALIVMAMVVPTVFALYWAAIKHETLKNPLPSMGVINNIIKMVARNTLAIYVLHAAFFVIAAWVLDAHRAPLATVTQFIK